MTITTTYRAAIVPPGAMSEHDARAAGAVVADLLSDLTTQRWTVTVVEAPLAGSGYSWQAKSQSAVVVYPAPKVNGMPDGYLAHYERTNEIVTRGMSPYSAVTALYNAWHERYLRAREARGVLQELRRGAA